MKRILPPLLLSLALATPATVIAQSLELIRAYERHASAANLDETLRQAREILRLSVAEFGMGSPEAAASLELLADGLLDAGREAEAAEVLRIALLAQEARLGADDPGLAGLLGKLGDALVATGRYDEAEAVLLRLIDIEAAAYGERHATVVETYERLRGVYEKADRKADAAKLEQKIEILTTAIRDFDPAGDEQRRYAMEDGRATVRVFYGTNRKRTESPRPDEMYGTERGSLEMGYLDVSIPETHRYGELETESRWSIYTYLLGKEAKQRRYVLLMDVRPLPEEDFFGALTGHMDGAPSRDLFIFVHGYNVSFEDAARRTAQLAYDLDFEGTPMMYSWPSQAATAAYTVDEAAVRVSGRIMSRFLEQIVERADADRIHLVAHSMGNRALIDAVETYIGRLPLDQRDEIFDQIVLTAPDVDRDFFVDAMDSMRPSAKRITLYASQNDVALKTSRIVHGAPRAGQAGADIVTLPFLDTIDMSAVEADALGHSYFAANEGAIYDLFSLFWQGAAPPQRCGMSAEEQAEFWLFDVDRCSGDDLLEAGVLLKRFGSRAVNRVQDRLRQLAGEETESSREEWSRILARLEALTKDDEEEEE